MWEWGGIMRHAWLLLAALSVAMALAQPPAHAQFARQGFIAFQSARMSRADFLNGKKGEPITLAGHLRLPKTGPGSLRWLGISDMIAEPEGPSFISRTVAHRHLDR
jgi:hypothetical protein